MTHDQQPMTIFRDHRVITFWLAVCALLVAMMVIIGGYTRLSGSGLSITEWKPVHGTIPPLSAESWQEEFSAYQQSPQYQKVNKGMTLGEFKIIFWPEYVHRLLGRIIGAVFFVPLVIFALRKSFSARFGWRLFGIFALGGLQGLIGWLMVASGLIDTPQVNAVRLALHLSVAFAILGLILWAMFDATANKKDFTIDDFLTTGHRPLPIYCLWFTLLCLQIILGALMAGTHAGLIYNTWPDMNGHPLPESWDSVTLIQFLHRMAAILVAFSFLLWWYAAREYVKNKHLGKVCAGVAAIIGVQFTLGVLTLIYIVPLPLALAHQFTGLVLFITAVILLHKLVKQ
jgi:cytochrome c oxidase assembly protein subunit 15